MRPRPFICDVQMARSFSQCRESAFTAVNMHLRPGKSLSHGKLLGESSLTMQIPVCKKHSKVIGRAKTLDWVALACFLIGFAAVLIVDTFGSRLFEFAPGIPWTLLVLCVPWGVALILLVAAGLTRSSAGHTPLRVESIDATGMTLGGVSSEFRDAVMQAEVQQTTVSDPS